jgi:phosphomannomutase
VVGLLARSLLAKNPGARIIHDPRLVWNTQEIVEEFGGIPIQSKTGHAFIKERMREEDALYGGEMSAHHYFRNFAYCDSGMIPWLLVAAVISESGLPLSALVAERIERFPVSGEINRKLKDPVGTLERIRAHYGKKAILVEEVDGLSFTYPDWRFNLRMSNTEPVVRLNVETRGDQLLMETRTKELLQEIESS